MSHQIIEPKFNGFLVNKIPDDPVDAGIIFHKMLAKSKQENDDSITGVLNGICERWSVTADHVKACIQAFVDAQDAWRENVAEWITIMIRNGGKMNCHEAQEFVYNGLPGHKIESSTAYALFRAEINSLGYNFQKSLVAGRLVS